MENRTGIVTAITLGNLQEGKAVVRRVTKQCHHRPQVERRNVGMEKKGHRAWTPTEEQQAAIREAQCMPPGPYSHKSVSLYHRFDGSRTYRQSQLRLRLLVPVREDEGTVNIREKGSKEVKPISCDELPHVTIHTAKVHDSDREFLSYEEDANVGGLILYFSPVS
ncbi:hypothetical protein PR048_033010 [Dryococelus australis]|uniref:Uncharacterized protein n=1 Tax=Dryococelus australis TaxID=614101 RepID=A0ABQ9G6P0_9NEOP|nr:hypothetical protein PR048_033010 [Dryococelus australis]